MTDITTTLAEMRERAKRTPWCESARDVSRLLAAIEAALKLHYRKSVYQFVYEYNGKILCGHTREQIEADVASHGESEDGDEVCLDKPLDPVCGYCADEDGDGHPYPCATVKAIADALNGDTDAR